MSRSIDAHGRAAKVRRRGRYAMSFVLAVGLCGSFCRQASAESFEVPALSSPANDIHLTGKLVWLDLETTDLPGAKRFYHTLFGWEYRDYHADGVDYTVAFANGNPVAGLVRRRIVNETERGSAWLPFFSVADVTATFQQALKAHGQVRSEPEKLPLRGRQARLKDPEGAVFALLTSSSGDPPDDANPRALGTWGSPALWARDPAGEAVFYQGLFGYAVQGEPADGGFERIRLSSGPHERASVRHVSGDAPAMRPQWISFVRVFSSADTAREAVKLGGQILAVKSRANHGATITLLEDPTGAAFGVQELPPETVQLGNH
jgi:predicted enzyme related to lactoylglutathione lyase